jgi:MFS family permease
MEIARHAAADGALRTAAPARRWQALAVVAAAQFMFVVDAFIVNVAVPAIRAGLDASAGEATAVIAIYQLAYAVSVITGGRLGDMKGRRRSFLWGVAAFTAASLLCGLAPSGAALVAARLAQGIAAALMVPQVLGTIHALFPDAAARAKAFAVFGVTLGLGGAAGFALGGVLLSADLLGLGWRAIFLVNLPVGAALFLAARALLPADAPRSAARLDPAGVAALFAGLALTLGPVLAGNDLGWDWRLAPAVLAGLALLARFLRLERKAAVPLIDPLLLHDGRFRRRLLALFAYHFGNTAFYLVMTLFIQAGLGLPPLTAGLVVVPLAVAFMLASRLGAERAGRLGVAALRQGCAVQGLGLACVAAACWWLPTPAVLAVVLVVFGWGQGLVMAPLFSFVLAGVPGRAAGGAAGVLATVQQIAAASGIALLGALYFGMAPSGHLAAVLAALLCLAGALSVAAALMHKEE